MLNLKKPPCVLFNFFFCGNIKTMPKKEMQKDKRKIYKCVRKTVDDNKDCLVIKLKNLKPIDVRELRNEINLLISDFFVQEQLEYVNQEASYLVSFPETEKEVHFEEKKKSCLKQNGKKTREKTSR